MPASTGMDARIDRMDARFAAIADQAPSRDTNDRSS
jgi:hypothetical protein